MVRIPSRPPDFKRLTMFLKTGWCHFCQLTSAPGNPSELQQRTLAWECLVTHEDLLLLVPQEVTSSRRSLCDD